MTQFSNDYFRDLPPRDRRYDTPVADQLVFSVFPNGVKAWVHVYPCDDFVRRRTMGLFPDMGFEDALGALEQSRRIAEVDAMEIRRRRPGAAHRRRYIVVGLLAAMLAAATAYLLSRAAPETSSQSSTSEVRSAQWTVAARSAERTEKDIQFGNKRVGEGMAEGE